MVVFFPLIAVLSSFAGGVPDIFDGADDQVLKTELGRPENFPAYVFKRPGEQRSRVGRYLLDGKVPDGAIECEHIRVLEKRDDAPLAWASKNNRASNVFYHVHKAIDYYKRLSALVGEPIYVERNKVNVRLDMDVDWAMWIKFSELQHFNHAQTFPDADPDKWGTPEEQREIWFHVSKRAPMPWYVPGRYLPGLKYTTAGTIGFPCDMAFVPTIIYHEWTHLMTRPWLGIERQTPLNEAYSDYFGSVIGGRPEMGNTEGVCTYPYARDFTKKAGVLADKDVSEPTEFLPRFLWALRARLGGDKTDVLAWKALAFLDRKSTLRDVPAALLKAAPAAALSAAETEELRSRLAAAFTARPPGRRGD